MPLTRREFLKGVGAAAGALGVTAAGYEYLVPYISQPDDMVPGVSTWYATSCRECPAGCGMLVKNRESRAIKCEGNPNHPVNHGTLCARGQAALQGLYDPDRIRGPLVRGNGKLRPTTWEHALSELGPLLSKHRGKIAIISDLQTGALEALMRAWIQALGSRLLTYEPVDYSEIRYTSDDEVVPSFDISKADYLISFGADFLDTWVSPVEYAGQFARMREMRNGKRAKFVYVGPRMSITAAAADLRMIVPPDAVGEIARYLERVVSSTDGRLPYIDIDDYGIDESDLLTTASDLLAAKAPLALPGGDSETGFAAMALNRATGTDLIDRARAHAVSQIPERRHLAALIDDMEKGDIDALVVLGANPAYSLPRSAHFAEALKRVDTVISLSSYMDETAALADWVLPSNTPLESWGDYEPYPDVANLMQPTMGALFDTSQTGDILIELARSAGVDPNTAFGAETFYDYLRNRWGAAEWESMLQVGGKWGTETKPIPRLEYKRGMLPPDPLAPETITSEEGLQVWPYPHIYLYDGRGANRRWLQELPEPLVKGAWDTWVELHPDTARELGISENEIVSVDNGNGVTMEAPAFIWEGVARGVAAIPIGQGHRDYGRYAKGVGANVLKLSSPRPFRAIVKGTGRSQAITRWKGSESQEGRHIAQFASLAPLPNPPPPGGGSRDSAVSDALPPGGGGREVTLPLPEGYTDKDFVPPHGHRRHRWAMVIDTDRCIGCGACTAACYAENNIGVVGADGIRRNREMAWLRIDRYIDWKQSAAPVIFQPMLCQQCDNAPCETVCPVYASVHSEDGINQQVYNRCVGTRYCSNNCPYKVRRFNFFDYEWPEPLQYQLNPDVTVRCRGVMEKCTFCIQRIRHARIVARVERRPLREDEVTPACAQTCPTGVFTFGDLMNPRSKVSKIIRTDPRAYQVLHELNTRPGVIYLRRMVGEV